MLSIKRASEFKASSPSVPAMRFALMEAKLALARTVLEFELRCAPGHEELELSLTPGVMRPKEDVFVTLTPIAKE